MVKWRVANTVMIERVSDNIRTLNMKKGIPPLTQLTVVMGKIRPLSHRN